MTFQTYEDRLDMIVTHALEQLTNNGLHMDADDREQTTKSTYDAAANTYIDGINDLVWLASTVARLRGDVA